MTKNKLTDIISGSKGSVAGAAVGSAAIAAALLFANKRRKKANKPAQLPHIPGGEKPETD